MKTFFNLRKFFYVIAVFLMVFGNFSYVSAISLTNLSDELSSNKPIVSATHTPSFKIATESSIKEIDFQFEKGFNDGVKPAHLNLYSTSLGTISGLNPDNWSLDKSNYQSGLLRLVSASGETKSVGDQITVNFASVTNPEIGDCTVSGSMYDNCYLTIKTYSDMGATIVDLGSTYYTIQDDPSLTFTVDGVGAGVNTNSITTTIPTTHNLIQFGTMAIREVKYAAQRLRVVSTAANGYGVTVRLDGYIEGLNPANKIDPFAGLNVAWWAPQLWSSPDGTTPSYDTGWIGANTTDSRVSGWVEGAGKFGPVSSTKHEVMHSNVKDYGTTAYVTYAMEVNEYQPYDNYAGNLVYEVTATY